MSKIQVGFLVSYDYELLKNAIPPVYEKADTIYLAIDKDRKTWNGSDFTINNSFFDWLKKIDVNNKIKLFEESFYQANLTTMECEVRERKMLAEKMGIGNWLIQLDADEYFLNFEAFVALLYSKNKFLKNPEKKQIQIAAYLVNIYKFVDDGFLYVNEPTRCLAVTNFPSYKVGRNSRKRILYTNSLILHETLSRSEEDLELKFKNWGHKNELNPEFMNKWKLATKENYNSIKDVFYIEPEKWKNLEFVEGKTMDLVAVNMQEKNFVPINFHIWKKNFGQWFKFLFK